MPNFATTTIGGIIVASGTFFCPTRAIACIEGCIGHIPGCKVNRIAVGCVVEQILLELCTANGVNLEMSYLVGSSLVSGTLCTIGKIASCPRTDVVTRVMTILNSPRAISVSKIYLRPTIWRCNVIGIPLPWCFPFCLEHEDAIFKIPHGIAAFPRF